MPLQIPSYKPTKGYFDLSNKPRGLTKAEHKKIQDIQTLLIAELPKYKDSRVREANYSNFQKLQIYMAELQYLILQYWPHEELFR